MTITMMSPDYPAPFRAITSPLRRVLRLVFEATDPCVDQLHAWAGEHADHPFKDWPEAVQAASAHLHEQPVPVDREAVRRSLATVVQHATLVVQRLYSLTNSDERLDQNQARVDADCDTLVRAAYDVPARYRMAVQVGELDEYLALAGQPRRYHDWERWPTQLLVAHPQLAANRPTVLPPGTADASLLAASSLVATKEEWRASATARLSAMAGNQPVIGSFTANSGRDVIDYRYPVPNPTGRGTIEYLNRQSPTSIRYQAFPATADPSVQATPRHLDAEKKIFELVAEILFAACTQARIGTHEVTGTLKFATGLRMCPSCYLVGSEFLVDFPQLQVTVSRLDRG